MRVVSDADVIIHLSKLKKLSLLKSLYDKIAMGVFNLPFSNHSDEFLIEVKGKLFK